jgi:hypothetical protein
MCFPIPMLRRLPLPLLPSRIYPSRTYIKAAKMGKQRLCTLYISGPLKKPLALRTEREKLTPPYSFYSKPRIVVSFEKLPPFPFCEIETPQSRRLTMARGTVCAISKRNSGRLSMSIPKCQSVCCYSCFWGEVLSWAVCKHNKKFHWLMMGWVWGRAGYRRRRR